MGLQEKQLPSFIIIMGNSSLNRRVSNHLNVDFQNEHRRKKLSLNEENWDFWALPFLNGNLYNSQPLSEQEWKHCSKSQCSVWTYRHSEDTFDIGGWC